jgi:hypothetical protein
MSFLIAVFAVIEHLNKSELTATSKKLIMAYVKEAGGTTIEKARAAVRRYTQTVLPTLDSIREKSQRAAKLDKLDHLVLKLEYEASRLPA